MNPPLPNLRAGYLALAIFAALGLVLESLHGFKIGAYLDAGNETRRLMWRLCHAHGALLGLLNIVYALSVRAFPDLYDTLGARALMLALVLLPLGFFGGGAFVYGGDPSPLVALAAGGAVALVFALVRIALVSRRLG